MTISSLQFFCFFIISIIFYYLFPKKMRWMVLLFFSGVFFLLSSGIKTSLYLLGCILATHSSCMIIAQRRDSEPGVAKIALAAGIVVNLSILAVLKYSNFFLRNWNLFAKICKAPLRFDFEIRWLAPIGISFYTLQAIGMILDTWWKITEPEKNIFKTALFVGYYPQLTSGPIAKYEDMKDSLYGGNEFSWTNFTHGLQRMVWGLFKKLVLSSRLSVIVNTIYGDIETYDGYYICLAAGLFMLQLYTDFSGCMDIIIGASETYGVNLPENFQTPFFARSVQEFWQRWHITLGGFMRDYLMYPLLRTNLWRKLTKRIKTGLGKKAAKQIPAYLSMLCVWFIIGLWHGGLYKYILGQGIWFWLCIVMEQAGEPIWSKMRKILHIRTESFGFHLFQSLRTFALVCFGNVFFRADSFDKAVEIIKKGFTAEPNPWIFFDGSLYRLGINEIDMRVLIVSLIILLIVSCLKEKGSVRRMIDQQGVLFRWLVYYLLIFSVMVFGKYGPGYNAADFIYRGF